MAATMPNLAVLCRLVQYFLILGELWRRTCYLQAEWNVRRSERDGPLYFNKDTIRGFSPRVPSQSNLVDCGIFLLHYVEMFFRLVLHRVPPDAGSSVESLVKSMSESAYTSSGTVRRDYAKSLCSKLVVVNAEYQRLALEFEAFKLDHVSDVSSKPKLTRLRVILRGIEVMLPSSESFGQSLITEAPLEEFPGAADDELGELCVLAERISF
ncbi:Sentrin-specific protease 7 [Sparganum proliferum]